MRDYGRVVRGMRHGMNHVLCGDVHTAASNESSVIPNVDPGNVKDTLAAYQSIFDPDVVRSAWTSSTRGCDGLINQVYSKYIDEVDGAAKNGTSIGTYDNSFDCRVISFPTNI